MLNGVVCVFNVFMWEVVFCYVRVIKVEGYFIGYRVKVVVCNRSILFRIDYMFLYVCK